MLISICWTLYFILGIGSIVVLSRCFENNTVEQELADHGLAKGGDSL